MKKILKSAIEEYQCCGCVCGGDISCYKKSESLSCENHCAGTRIYPNIGRIFLGMPKGFCRLGAAEDTKISIFALLKHGWVYDKFNVPIWKYLDNKGNTIVRGMSPRINYPWVHIFLENCMNKIDCLEITQKDIDKMD